MALEYLNLTSNINAITFDASLTDFTLRGRIITLLFVKVRMPRVKQSRTGQSEYLDTKVRYSFIELSYFTCRQEKHEFIHYFPRTFGISLEMNTSVSKPASVTALLQHIFCDIRVNKVHGSHRIAPYTTSRLCKDEKAAGFSQCSHVADHSSERFVVCCGRFQASRRNNDIKGFPVFPP
uniref:Putative nicotinamide n-methyltransferase n=1 Tax=Ixodes ricinus TaxID=34613 RepID=A0A0K8RLM7_IXORI